MLPPYVNSHHRPPPLLTLLRRGWFALIRDVGFSPFLTCKCPTVSYLNTFQQPPSHFASLHFNTTFRLPPLAPSHTLLLCFRGAFHPLPRSFPPPPSPHRPWQYDLSCPRALQCISISSGFAVFPPTRNAGISPFPLNSSPSLCAGLK